MKRRRSFIAAGVVLIVLIGVGVVRWANRPVSTNESKTTQADTNRVLGSVNSVSPFVTPYFSTQIPSDMQRKTSNEDPRGAIMASYLLTNVKPAISDQAAMTVGNLGLNTLSEISDVKRRLNDPTTYQAVAVDNAPPGAMGFVKPDSYEIAVFWKQGSQYVATVVSGAPQRETELNQIMQTILTNWKWR